MFKKFLKKIVKTFLQKHYEQSSRNFTENLGKLQKNLFFKSL